MGRYTIILEDEESCFYQLTCNMSDSQINGIVNYIAQMSINGIDLGKEEKEIKPKTKPNQSTQERE